MYKDASDESDDEEEAATRANKELGEFASKISIAGIDDAYKAESPFIRGLFIGSIVVFTIAMIYSSCNVGIRYAQEDAIALNWRPVDNEPAPFPNVTICFPVMTNEEAKKDFIYSDRDVQRKLRRLNVSREEAGSFLVSELFGLGSSTNAHQLRLSAVAEKIIDASIREYGTREFLRRLMVPCERSFAKCHFAGVKFECCRVVTLMANFNTGVCWEMNLAGVTNSTNSSSLVAPSTDHLDMDTTSGLSIEVHYDLDSTIFDEDQLTSDGFMVLLDPPTPFTSTPAVIPCGADAHVILAPPVRNRDIDRCASNESKSSIKFADRYDARGLYCAAEYLIELDVKEIGCTLPMMTYFPDESNDTTCDGAVLAAMVRLTSSNGGALMAPSDEMLAHLDVDQKRKLDEMMTKYEPQIRSIISGSDCSPICERWTYKIWSTSYGYIKYKGDEFEQNWRFANGTNNPSSNNRSRRAMSRIRVFFPTTSYEIWSQEEVALSYLAFCEIAGVWGVYLGFSIVTFVQAMAYGVMTVRVVRKRKSKVAACGDNAISMKVKRANGM